jgi:hypothetical protein
MICTSNACGRLSMTVDDVQWRIDSAVYVEKDQGGLTRARFGGVECPARNALTQ